MKIIKARSLKKPFRIAIAVSRFNIEISDKLLEGALERLAELEVPEDHITVVWVPGAVELSLTAQQLAEQDYSAIICLGSVIFGQTDHYTYVCQSVTLAMHM